MALKWHIELHEPLYTQIRLEWLVVTGKVTVYQLRFDSIFKIRWGLDRPFHRKNSSVKPANVRTMTFHSLRCRTELY